MNSKQKYLLRIVIAIIFIISGVVQFINQDILMGIIYLVGGGVFLITATKKK